MCNEKLFYILLIFSLFYMSLIIRLYLPAATEASFHALCSKTALPYHLLEFTILPAFSSVF